MPTTALALLGLASVATGWILTFVVPGARVFAWGILAVGAALIAAAFVIDFRRVRGALASRRGRFGVGTTVGMSLFVGIILLANAISVGAYHRFDFTGLAQFTLTSQTKDVLVKLDKPVEVVSFFTPGVASPVSNYAQSLLAEYRNHTDRLTVRSIDPDLSPDQARQYGVDQMGALLGVVVFTGGAGRRQVFGPQILGEAEHAFTGAILEVTGTRQKKVYFLTGHGESGLTTGYSSVGSGLRDNLFRVGELDLLATPTIPEDAAAVIVAGPRQPLASTELQVLGTYLENGGRLFVLLDPNPRQGLRRLLSAWWLDVEDGPIVDPTSHVAPNKDTLLVTRNRNSLGLAETYFPGATALLPRDPVPDTVDLSALVWSSPDSWLEKDPTPGAEPTFDEHTERKGPLAIGALISTKPTGGARASGGTRLAVIGDSDFAVNRHFHNGNNSGLFLTAVNWLVEDEDVISVDRKVLTIRRLLLSPEQARFLHLSSIGLLPLLLLVIGGFVWWRRRSS